MKLKLKEDPKEWRKHALLAAGGLSVLSTVLRFRHVLPKQVWLAVLAVLAVVALCAIAQPRWFRGYYRVTGHIGFYISQVIGHVLFSAVFLLVLTPLGIVLRLSGKDSLRLKRPREASTCWNTAKEATPLDRSF